MSDQVNEVVRIETIGRVGLIVLDNPPVNAASLALRQGILGGLERLEGTVDVIALYAEGRTFVAGADIREFGGKLEEPLLPALIARIEASETPVVAVIHGTALGGGLELALGCHARVAVPAARMGLPEIHLGIFPGAGGTQRAPRLAGIKATLDLILSGRQITAPEALDLGLVDQLIDAASREAALHAAQAVLDGDLKTRRTGDLTVTPDEEALAAARAQAARTPALIAPPKAIDAIAASTGPMADGLAWEWDLFLECLAHPQSRALIHAFFAERQVGRVPESHAAPREINACGVIGGGTMGTGIATAMLLAGLPVTLIEQNPEAANRARKVIADNLDGAVRRGKMTPEKRKQVSLATAADLDALNRVDLIVEAVFEEMDVKKSIFRALDQIAKQGAVLASNTSYLDIDEIAAETTRPQDVIGLHFFSPAHVMRLLEVVVADKTAPEVTATGFALAKRLRKIAVRAGVCDGFIGNRILRAYGAACEGLLLDGATPQQVDRALEAWGFAMGPFSVFDLAGLDIGWATRKRRAATRDPAARQLDLPDRICEAGRFGRKTGRGYYLYADGQQSEDPEVIAWLEEERAAKGITPRAFTEEEIQDRALTAMIAEGARVIDDGIALAPVDIDAVYLFGYGFPRHRGGPMYQADLIGPDTLADRIRSYAPGDPAFWRVPPIVDDMARTGRSFADLNKERA